MPTQDKYTHWQNLLSQNRFEKLLPELREVFAQSEHLMSIIQQEGRYASLVGEIIDGTISPEDKTRTENQIRKSIGLLLAQMKTWEETDKQVAREIAAAITITGNVTNSAINSNITAEKVHFGDVHYHGEAIPHFLTPRPQRPEIFVGRKGQLKDLHEQLFTPGTDHFLLLVNGEGGIGKTSLAATYFHRYHKEYAHAAWMLGDTSIAGALLTLAIGLKLEFGPTEDTNQRLHRLMTRLANLNEYCLLVIDNANNLTDLDANYDTLYRCDNFHLLLTSRLSKYSRARLVAVNPLDTDTAQNLFATHYRPLTQDEATLFPEIYHAVGGNTLVLEILSKNLQRVNTLRERYTLADLLADLQKKGLLQLAENRDVETSYGKLRRAKPAEIIGVMYELEELNEIELVLLSVFAALPPDKIPTEHLEVLLGDLTNLEEPLLSLAQRGWLEFEATEGSFRCSQVVQEVVRAKNSEWREVLPLLRSNIEDHLATDQGYIKIGIAAARPYVMYGEAIAPFLPREEANLFFYQQLAIFHNSSGDLRANMEWVEQMASLSQELLTKNEEDPDLKNGLAISYEKLGKTHSALGNLSKALEYFEIETTLFKELHAAHPAQVGFKNGLAISYTNLASVVDDVAQQKGYYQDAEKLWSELNSDFPDYKEFENNLGWVRERLRDL